MAHILVVEDEETIRSMQFGSRRLGGEKSAGRRGI